MGHVSQGSTLTRGSTLTTSLVGVVVGLAAEAEIARRLSSSVLCSGGRPEIAARHAKTLIDAGAASLMSFGIAGGLAPGLPPGTLVVATEIITEEAVYPARADCAGRVKARAGAIYGATEIVATAREKSALSARTGAIAVDLESGPVARQAMAAGIPFIAVRAIADPAWDSLPVAALLPLDTQGRPRLPSVLWSVLRDPRQISGLVRIGRETRLALESLRRARRRLARPDK
jgi:hopanoid-associated phosphorylase